MSWGAIGGAAVSLVGGSLLSSSANKKAGKASDAAANAANTQAEIALDQWESFKEIYQPVERNVARLALQSGTDEDLARAAGEASTTVATQFGKARDRLARTPGADPSSGAFQAGLVGLELGQAAADATAQNKARQTAKDTAFAKQVDAASVGKGLPAQAMSGLSSAASTQSAIASQQSSLASGQAANFGGLVSNVANSINKAPAAGSSGSSGVTMPTLGLDYNNLYNPGAVTL